MAYLLVQLLALSILLPSLAFSASSRSGTVTVSVDLSAQKPGEGVRLWLPYPVSDRQQTVSKIGFSGDYAQAGVYTDPVNGTPILYAEWPALATSRTLSLAFEVTRQEQRVASLPNKEAVWNRADFADELKGTRLGPVDGEVKKLAERIVKGKKTLLAKARAIYDWTVENMYRDPATRGCGKGDVCLLLLKPGGKCTDISSVFVALCRAAGVPAREIFGLRLGREASADLTGGQHCWAEFFLPGSGWVPADPADVRKAMLVEKLDINDQKTKAYRDYYWGGLDPYRVRIALGRDLVLNPPQAGPPLNTFGYPYAEIGGQPLDVYDAEHFSYRIAFKEAGAGL